MNTRIHKPPQTDVTHVYTIIIIIIIIVWTTGAMCVYTDRRRRSTCK